MHNTEIEKLNTLLISNGYTKEKIAQNNSINFVEHIITQNLISYNNLKEILSVHFSIKNRDISEEKIDEVALSLISHEIALKYNILPFNIKKDETLQIFVTDPFNYKISEDISILTNKKIDIFFAEPTQIMFFIDMYYNSNKTNNIINNIKKVPTKLINEENPAIKIIEALITSAILKKASDIHIEPNPNNVNVRFRIDGALNYHQAISINIFPNVVTRLKIMANLDISESRFPKDGSFKLHNIKNIDFRISILPTIFGEKVAIRLIYKEEHRFSLNSDNIGFSIKDMETIKNLLNQKSGAILVTGPTGSGKTTTLSSFISYLNKEDVNITTVEDPVENVLHGVNHVNINTKIGLNFNTALRHILRQDPDIIMIGEIRDTETAAITISAAITGHLVFSTLHTNDAISTISRLIDMGIEKYLLIESIKGIISQRLVRRLCDNCKQKYKLPPWLNHILVKNNLKYDMQDITLFKKGSCTKCFGTGYKGRFAVYEIVSISEDIKNTLSNENLNTNLISIRNEMLKNNVTLSQNAIYHLINGNTSLEEVYSLINQ